MITPMSVIIPQNNKPDRCPNCGCEEEQITICKNCKYEYPEDEGGGWGCLFMAGLVITVLFFFCTFASWIVEFTSSYMPFKGSYIDYLAYIFKGIINIIKNIF